MEMPNKAHCLLVPFPATGHVNPMLHFSKRLRRKGVKATMALTNSMYESVHQVSNDLKIETFSDGKEDAVDIHEYMARLPEIGARNLTRLVARLRDSGTPVDCIVYDGFMNWVLEVARKSGVAAAVFFSQSCAVNNVYYHYYKGLVKVPNDRDAEGQILVPGVPKLEVWESPSYNVVGPYPAVALEFFFDQFSNFDKADWILVNSFHDLEKEVVDWMVKKWRIWTVGPMVPSGYLDRRLEGDKEYGLNFFNPNTDTCIEWLDKHAPRSVVYISFGSRSELGAEQIEELAWGLEASNKCFLWVISPTEAMKMPKNFVEETREKGLVVSWCPQLEVLAHEAIGCFVTHCGWNSTLEAISLGVPVVAMAQWADQVTNAKYIVDVWENGIRARQSLKGIVMRDEVQYCLKEVMEGQQGKDSRKRAKEWKDLAKKAVDEGGSSDRNIDHLVAALAHSKAASMLN